MLQYLRHNLSFTEICLALRKSTLLNSRAHCAHLEKTMIAQKTATRKIIEQPNFNLKHTIISITLHEAIVNCPYISLHLAATARRS